MKGNNKFQDYCSEIMEFFRSQGVKIDPEPAVVLKNTSVSRFDVFAPTGNYDFTTQTITLYISNRHAKDILRSFCHELVHHSQYLKDPKGYAAFDKSGKIMDNGTLRGYEKDAYLKGNVLFREWTEEYREGE